MPRIYRDQVEAGFVSNSNGHCVALSKQKER